MWTVTSQAAIYETRVRTFDGWMDGWMDDCHRMRNDMTGPGPAAESNAARKQSDGAGRGSL
jgi:hypothetical protein